MAPFVFSKCMSSTARQKLVSILDNYTFTCSATLSDLELLDCLSDICVRDLECYNPLEKLYFAMTLSVFTAALKTTLCQWK